MTSLPKVAVVLVNYNGAEETRACLASLQTLEYPDYEIFVVDNDSAPEDVAKLSEADTPFQLIHSDRNRGFAGGCNLGIQKALEDPEVVYVWLLNNDATVEPSTLTALVETAQAHSQALVGSVVYHPDGRFQRVGNRLHPVTGRLKEYTLLEVETCPQVESLTGASMLLPRKGIEIVGLWDEGYFLYFEDNDYCFRARQKGYACVVSLNSRVFHKEGATTGKNRPLVTYYYQRNRLRLACKILRFPAKMGLLLYTRFRLFRSTIKAMHAKDPDFRRHHEAFCLAVEDFKRGVEGPCPHKI